MKAYIVLIRGINVGGKNKVLMANLRERLSQLGFSNVSTYIASGNVVLESDKNADEITHQVEKVLSTSFELDDEIIRVVVLTRAQFQAVIDQKPTGFGEQPKKYRSDVIFLIGIDPTQAMSVFNPREGVDEVWSGSSVLYSQRLSSQLTKSRFSRIVGTPEYQLMTIRSWNTVLKLLERVEELGQT